MLKTLIKSAVAVILFLVLVSWHLKLFFIFMLFLIWRKHIPGYERKKRVINRVVIGLLFMALFFAFPDRRPSANDYIQSVYYDRSTGEEMDMPWIPYLTNIIWEGDLMALMTIASHFVPEGILGGAIEDVMRYNRGTSFLKNNFHLPYRDLARRGAPPHHVPFQLMKDRGYYESIGHYFLHVPENKPPEDCEVIVFCHGYTGNWLLYPELLARHTDAIIIAVESLGLSGYFSPRVMREIVRETLPHAFKRIGINPVRPHLIGLSNGGSAVNNAVLQYPNTFKSFTILSARLRSVPPSGKRVHVLYGEHDRSGGVNAGIPGSRFARHVIEEEDHSLFVSRPGIVFDLISEITGS